MTLGLGADSGGDREEFPSGGAGKLPRGWARAMLAELCDVNPRSFDDEPRDDDFISRVPMAAVEAETGRIDASSQVRYGDFKKKSLTRFQENDVLFAKITPCMENGKIAVARGLLDGRALGSTEFHVLRSLGAVLPEYLMHYLLQRDVRANAEQNMSGAVGQRRVPRPYLEAFEIPVPPLAEQRRIVAEIERQISHIEAGEVAADQAIQTILELDAAILESSLTRTAGSSRTLRTLISQPLTNGKSVPTLDGGFPVLRLNSVHGRTVDTSIKKGGDWGSTNPRSYLISEGDFLVIRGNGTLALVGRGALVPELSESVAYPDTLIRVRVDKKLTTPAYLDLVWNSRKVRQQIESQARTTAGIYKINQSILGDIEIPYASPSDQELIVEEVTRVQAAYAPLADEVKRIRSSSAELRAALLHAAFTGTLLPQDPADEPASVLLDRIRATRATAKKAPRKRASRKPRSAPPGQEELPQ